MPLKTPLLPPALVLCLVLSQLASCAPFPQMAVGARIAPGPAPRLVPVDDILVQADALRPAGAATAGVQARAAALRARALRLRGL